MIVNIHLANPEVWIVSIFVNLSGWLIAGALYWWHSRRRRNSGENTQIIECNKLHGGG